MNAFVVEPIDGAQQLDFARRSVFFEVAKFVTAVFNALENRVVLAGRRALRIDADGALADFDFANFLAINRRFRRRKLRVGKRLRCLVELRFFGRHRVERRLRCFVVERRFFERNRLRFRALRRLVDLRFFRDHRVERRLRCFVVERRFFKRNCLRFRVLRRLVDLRLFDKRRVERRLRRFVVERRFFNRNRLRFRVLRRSRRRDLRSVGGGNGRRNRLRRGGLRRRRVAS